MFDILTKLWIMPIDVGFHGMGSLVGFQERMDLLIQETSRYPRLHMKIVRSKVIRL